MAFRFTVNNLSHTAHHYQAFREEDLDQPLTFVEALNFFQTDSTFRRQFIEYLIQSPFDAFRFESPPICERSIQRDFEFVLVDCPTLAKVEADRSAFAEHFHNDSANGVTVFENLGRDATLVVPCPGPDTSNGTFAHLAAFTRQAEPEHQHRLWAEVGTLTLNRLNARPLWLNTAGMGVYWLHIRLDQRPKYYAHGPFKHRP